MIGERPEPSGIVERTDPRGGSTWGLAFPSRAVHPVIRLQGRPD